MAEVAVPIAILLLAGGESRRFPNKLEHAIDGVPMIVAVYRQLRAAHWPIYVAGKGSFSPAVDAQLDAPLLLDRRPRGGPLHAFLAACGVIQAQRIFAVAGDHPSIDAALLEELAARWRSGDEAVVPEHEGRIEPLAALYDRRAVLREAFDLQREGNGAMRELVRRVRARFVAMNATRFRNVNRPGDLMGAASR